MLRMRSRIGASRADDRTLVVQITWTRRALYGALAILLIAAFLVSYDSRGEQSNGSVAGTIFYAVLTLACVGVAGWNSRTVFRASEDSVVSEKRFFGVVLKTQSIPRPSVTGVTLQSIRLLKTHEVPQQGLFNNRFRGFAARRSQYFKLFLELTERRVVMEDSSYQEDLERVAVTISEFLGVPLQHEEV